MTTDSLATLKIPIMKRPVGGESVRDSVHALSSTSITLKPGSKLFVVGPNGSGKSALLNHWVRSQGDSIKIIRAHRKNWMKSSTVNILPQARLEAEKNYKGYKFFDDARYTDPFANSAIDVPLFDLVESENHMGRELLKLYDNNPFDVHEKFRKNNRPVHKLNEILACGLLNVEITIDRKQTVQATKYGKTYEASQLSDGERNALILSSQILCAPEGTIFFIDEPEQHLHRAIASPLLSALIGERADCAFVIFTHELSLVETIEDAEVLVLHGCTWAENNPKTWDCNLLKSDEDIPNNTKQAILGGRKQILFVEGENASLDRRLYEVMYPNFTIHPTGSCTGVIRAVRSLKEFANLHWVKAYGIIDHDGRSEDKIKELEKDGIFALQEFSIESLFYGQESRNIIAQNKARELGKKADDLLAEAEEKIVSVLSDQCKRLATRRCSPEARPEDIKKEECLFRKHLQEKNLNALMARYPVRETRILKEIAKVFFCPTCREYEMAVGECAKNNEQFRNSLKDKLPKIGGETG